MIDIEDNSQNGHILNDSDEQEVSAVNESPVRYARSEDFDKAANLVFEHHDELLQKLSQ